MDASYWMIVGWVSLHVAAFSTAVITRIAEGSMLEALARMSFFAAMTTIGAVAAICQQLDLGWAWSAITLVGMVVTAVVDFTRHEEPARVTMG